MIAILLVLCVAALLLACVPFLIWGEVMREGERTYER